MKVGFSAQGPVPPMRSQNRPMFGKDGGSSGLGSHKLPANFPLRPQPPLLEAVHNWGMSILNALGAGFRRQVA